MSVFSISRAHANESLRIAGMGGAFVGLKNGEGGIFGNPAGLVNIQANNLSVALSAQNMSYENLPVGEGEQTDIQLSFRLGPSIYYSRVIKGFGIGLGYIGDLDNRSSTLIVKNTEAEYIIDERKFASTTDTILEYDLFQERGPVFSVGYPIKPELSVGIRLRYLRRIIKEGVIHRPMSLTAVHGPEVNRNDATKLLPAIIDNLDLEDSIDRFKKGEGGHEDVVADLSGSGMDLDLGMQAKLYNRGNISGGFMLEHLIQRRIVKPQPSRIILGVSAQPKRWITAALDLQQSLASSEMRVSLGWEVSQRWQRWFSGGITFRNGFAYESPDSQIAGKAKNKLSVGIGIMLGSSHWDYTFVKPMDGSSISKAAHIFSSTTRF